MNRPSVIFVAYKPAQRAYQRVPNPVREPDGTLVQKRYWSDLLGRYIFIANDPTYRVQDGRLAEVRQ